jgi:hypothetical protein
LVDTRKNYNCYVEKIEKYSKLAADCRSNCDRVVSLYNNPPILDFTAISSMLGKINKVYIHERACMGSESVSEREIDWYEASIPPRC